MRWLVALAALVTGLAWAQYSPELEAFAGSRANLERLVAGLHGGTSVTLLSLTPEGMREYVTFTAAQALPPEEIARVLESARYRLLDAGNSEPSGWEIALLLMGRMEIAPGGPLFQPGLLAPGDPERPLVLSLRPFAGSAGNYRRLLLGLSQGWRVVLADPRAPRSSVSFTPRCALSGQDRKRALLSAAEQLPSDPTLAELRAALVRTTEDACNALAS